MSDLEKYNPMIKAILSASDLQVITVKKIRIALQALFGVDLSEHKKELGEMIMEEYYQLLDVRESETKLDDEKKATKIRSSLKTSKKRPQKPKRPSVAKPINNKPIPNNNDGHVTFMTELYLSPKLRAFLKCEMLPRPHVVKKIWQHIKAHDLQNPDNKREILCDEAMEPIFGKKVNMYTMNKILSDHVSAFPFQGDTKIDKKIVKEEKKEEEKAEKREEK